jgi:hypothetical protein
MECERVESDYRWGTADDMAQVVECLSSMWKALGSFPHTQDHTHTHTHKLNIKWAYKEAYFEPKDEVFLLYMVYMLFMLFTLPGMVSPFYACLQFTCCFHNEKFPNPKVHFYPLTILINMRALTMSSTHIMYYVCHLDTFKLLGKNPMIKPILEKGNLRLRKMK